MDLVQTLPEGAWLAPSLLGFNNTQTFKRISLLDGHSDTGKRHLSRRPMSVLNLLCRLILDCPCTCTKLLQLHYSGICSGTAAE